MILYCSHGLQIVQVAYLNDDFFLVKNCFQKEAVDMYFPLCPMEIDGLQWHPSRIWTDIKIVKFTNIN